MDKQKEKLLLQLESEDNLVVKGETNFGIKVYNSFHEKDNVCRIDDDIDVITLKIWRGWKIYPGKNRWILQAPEVTLSDLSETHKNPVLNLKDIYAYHKVLDRIDIEGELNEIIYETDKFKGLSAIVISGKYKNVEHRIAFSDMRGKKLPYFLYKKVKNKYENLFTEVLDNLDEEHKAYLDRPLDIERLLAEKDGSMNTKFVYNYLLGLYSRLGVQIDRREHGWILRGIWDNVPDADMYVFVPKSGIKFGLGFIEDRMKNDPNLLDKIMFWECHVGMDSMKDVIFMKKDILDKRVVVVDKSYSGKTLKYLHHQILSEGGNPITMAMFPKSKESALTSDYIMFQDRCFDTKEISIGTDWYDQMFWEAAKRKNP